MGSRLSTLVRKIQYLGGLLGSKRIKVLSTLSPTTPITNTRFNSLLAPVAAIMKKTIKSQRNTAQNMMIFWNVCWH